MNEFRRWIIAMGKPVLNTRTCGYCLGIMLEDGKRFCCDRCERRNKEHNLVVEHLQGALDLAREQIEKLKADNLRPLRERIARIERENACLIDENLALRKGCEQIKALDNPAVRWIHRALRNADLIRKNFKKS